MLTDSTQYHETVIQPNGREYRRGNHKWTIQRNIGYTRRRKTQKNTTQYVLDTSIQTKKYDYSQLADGLKANLDAQTKAM